MQLYNQDIEGIIDIDHINAQNGPASNYFISGPTAMIKIFKNVLIEKDGPTGNVLTDDWE